MLKILYEEALSHHRTTNIDNKTYESQMLLGVQIVKDRKTNNIKIYASKGMEYYDEITKHQYSLFKNGWKTGVWEMKKKYYLTQLDLLEERRKSERNGAKSEKALENYKGRKTQILKKFNTIRELINNHKPKP
tara:strand:+ start:888 stop:1286 length:399 start_codon:yes stop_codon:yes gene_type:complete